MGEDDKKYLEAKRRVRMQKRFYKHLLIFIVINAALIFLNVVTRSGKLWFYIILFPWAIILAIHFVAAFNSFGFFGKEWEERKIQDMIDEDEEDDE